MQPEVWTVWPSAQCDRCESTSRRWQAFGCKVAVMVDWDAPTPESPDAVFECPDWRGYPTAMNTLCRAVPGQVVICAADDIYPPEELPLAAIYTEFLERFPDAYGVMQPTGDRFASIDLCCPSPWLGRALIEQLYDGTGPFFPEYYHYFCDEELKVVAEMNGVLWQRQDISQYHDHWQRAEDGGTRPAHLIVAKDKHKAGQELFQKRKASGFPGHNRRVV